MAIKLHLIKDLQGIHECENLQKNVWGFSDLSIVPHHLVLTTLHAGGILIGAYDGQKLVGFAYSIPGYLINDSDEITIPKHCSLMAGVLPEYRSKGVGYLLKNYQRDCVAAQAISLITWTFDPLQALNAHFNFSKLGVICREYSPDLYGDMRDEINKGMPTDRFTVEWWIASDRVNRRSQAARTPRQELKEISRVNQVITKDDAPINDQIDLSLKDPELLIEIPSSIGKIKAQAGEAALRWRMETRTIFSHYLTAGYTVTDVLSSEKGKGRRLFYLLEKVELDELLSRGTE